MKILRLIGMLLVSVTVSINSLTCNAQNYKGSIEGGRTFHTDDIGMFSTTDIYTTHGVQLGSRFYIGAGVGVRLGDDYTSIPLYGSVRYTFLKKKISPFIDAKVGYSLLDAAGFYANPGAGVNWNFYKALSVFLKVGYTYNSKAYGEAWNKDGDDVYPHGVSASIGFSF
ncbi:hypothetical protein ACRFA2_14595 [Bacteroides hominis]|jgi:hypothetical protein|uniref:Porin family protein n=1 Tax=Bacteroides stercoris TaxID=46506 RepID=A0A412E965_BACSE|nr:MULTISPECIES: hypothetical protein [Bacteroides]MCS2715255.1 hypothetical protein [Bacteroides thetaiotaomicron]MCS2875555.1 hypothetical protein [Bacteroides thetaiotaomicron]MDV6173143.1 hypothetical protein [Bacteroides hominis (ex Liu et al. 2022)]RGR29287.1 hypothetical protein DWY58_04495 [Bacteroides stercoris]RGR38045.1 hypothetical protein DWY52_03980 [Bacteroides stercoris]